MATTQNTYTGDNSTTLFSFTFPYLEESDVKVSLDGVDKTQTTDYTFANATQISFNTAPGTGVAIRIYRETNIDAAQATFFAGSSIRSQDLNDNNNQLLYSTQETVNRRVDSTGGTMTGDLTLNDADLVFEGSTADAFETTLTVVDPTADRTITLPNVTGTVVTTGDTGTVATAMIAADAVNGTKIADDSIDSEHYVDASIDTAHIADAQITTAKIAGDAVTNAKIADDSIDSEHYVDGSIDTAHIADLQVTTAKIANDAVTNSKIADNAITTEHYADASIYREHLQADIIDGTKIADDAVNSEHIADNAVDSQHYVDGSIDTAHIGDSQVTTAKIADGAVTNAKLADAELQELATMGGLTAAALADLTQAEVQILDGATVTTAELNKIDGLTADATDLNQLDTNTLTNSPTWTSTSQYPSAASIDSRITARIDPLGGFEAIADEDSFPATAPPEGTVVSIANANGLAVNSSGVGAGTRAGGSDAVVINGFPSGFNSTSLDDGIGLLVVATSTAHTYDFHRVVAKDEDVRQLSSDINDFKARYRVGSSNPTTDNDPGDLFFNTGTDKMLVRNAANDSWDEVQSIGEFFINTLSSSSGTGGGSATFNGTAYRFTLSNAPTNAEQLIVSINGVVQKPNSGTSQPSEGFAIDGSDIIFGAAPASGSDFFIVTIGSSVNIGTPSAGTVGATQLIDDSITEVKLDIHNAPSNGKFLKYDGTNGMEWGDVPAGVGGATGVDFNDNVKARFGTGNDLEIYHDGSNSYIQDAGTGSLTLATDGANIAFQKGSTETLAIFKTDNACELYYDNSKKLETTSSGIDVTGSIDCDTNIDIVESTSTTNTELLSLRNTSGTAATSQIGFYNAGLGSATTRLLGGNTSASGAGTFEIQCTNNSGTAQTMLFMDNTTNSSDIQFRTANADRMCITNAGNVGIGTTTPSSQLELAGSAPVITLDATGNNQPTINLQQSGTTYARFRFDGSNVDIGNLYSGGGTIFNAGNVERMRINSAGRVMIGTTTPGHSNADDLTVAGSGHCGITIRSGSTSTGALFFSDATSGSGEYDGGIEYNQNVQQMTFYTATSNRMKIEANGRTGIFTTDTDSFDVGNSNGTGTSRKTIRAYHSATGIANGTEMFYVSNNGDVRNATGSYSSISDAKLKENIVDAPSQWDDIKALQVRKFNFTEESNQVRHTQIGLVAQEVETVCPGLVDDDPDLDENGEDLGTVTKGVKYSVLYMKSVKALQEAMTRIEALETANASLEARLTALEGGN